jgi:hypothetical protein
MTTNPSWRELYEAALVEVQPEQLRRRIDAAEKVIHQRVEELERNGTGSAEEFWAINDALRSLRVLAKTECQPLPSEAAGGQQTGTRS